MLRELTVFGTKLLRSAFPPSQLFSRYRGYDIAPRVFLLDSIDVEALLTEIFLQ